MLKMIALFSLVSAAVAQTGTTAANTMKKTTPPAHSGANSPTK